MFISICLDFQISVIVIFYLMIDLQLSLAEMILSKSLKWVENWKAPVSKGSLILEGF